MAATSSVSEDRIDLASIVPFSSSPLKKVPKYLFGNPNPNQTSLSYVAECLSKLRERARVIKLSEITTLKEEDSRKIAIAKEHDWIYCLDQLEKDYLPREGMQLTALKIKYLVKINRYLSRFTHANKLRDAADKVNLPGEFRKENLRSSIHCMNATEVIAFQFIEEEVSKEIRKVQRESKDRPQPISDPSTIIKQLKRKKTWLSKKLIDLRKLQSKDKSSLFSRCSYKEIKDLVNSWADSNDNIDLIKWLKDRIHYFPAPLEIQSKLQKVIDSIKSSKMHPIEKAAKICFDFTKIHVFNNANLETARVMGYAILLSYGYLPPIIGVDDYKKHLACIDRGIEKEEEGHIPLTNFLAKQILNTQNKFKSDPRGDISAFS
ncbi:MAG: hypothetical protein K1060chlam1_00314 [Candidatus Anoxychlamydiales bacterium]|nr:hypothetical protein [Candidatus Anoxychlamydiales bacterium]